MDPLFFEQVLIKLLFFNLDIQQKVFPFLTVDIFDKIENKNIVQRILDFYKKVTKFPNISELKLDLIKDEDQQKYFIEIIETNISEYDSKFLLEKIEEFFKKKLIFHEIVKATELLKDDDLNKLLVIPDNIRTSVAFSFDTNVGMNVFSENGKKRMYEHIHQKNEVISTKLPDLDRAIGGGFHKKSVSVLLGQGNIGKTLIACAMSANQLHLNKKILYITMELTEEYITQRIIQNLFNIDQYRLKELSEEEFNKEYDKCIDKFKDLLVVKKYSPGINCSHIRHLFKELEMKNNFRPDLLYVDYLGELDSIKEGNNSNDIGKYKCQELEGIAFDFDIPVVTPAQVNRGGYSTSSLDPTDVADSIGIFTETDLVIGITQTQEQYDGNSYTLDIMKNRFGDKLQKVIVGVNRALMQIFTPDELKLMSSGNDDKIGKMTGLINMGEKAKKEEKKNKTVIFN